MVRLLTDQQREGEYSLSWIAFQHLLFDAAHLSLVKQVEAELLSPSIRVGKGERLVLAVSGGIDSMVLLSVVSQLAREHGWSLCVAHFNHGLRGAESDADAVFVKGEADRLGWPCVGESGDVRGLREREGISVEMAARRLRLEFLTRTAREVQATKVLLAHHLDDQVELFFIRLFRGTGSDGLAGMRAISPSPMDGSVQFVRPLLGFSKAVLLHYGEDQGLAHREDESNQSTEILRNRVRKELLPLLETEFSSSLKSLVGRTMGVLGDEHAHIEAEARAWCGQGGERQPFEQLSIALQREVLRLQILDCEVVPDFRLIETLRVSRPHGRVSTTGGRELIRAPDGSVHMVSSQGRDFDSRAISVEISSEPQTLSFGGAELTLSVLESGREGEKNRSFAGRECFDADQIGAVLTFRFWQPGDLFEPIGLGHRIKVQDWFVNEKVPLGERRQRVMGATEQGDLFWIEGMRISERFKLTPATNRVLELRWQRREKFC